MQRLNAEKHGIK